MARAFKVRSGERDARTDGERLGSISVAIITAITAIQRERDALRARVADARDLAAFAAGTDYDEYLTREAKDEARIKEYEVQMELGEKRTQELDRQLGALTSVQELFNRHFGGVAEGR